MSTDEKELLEQGCLDVWIDDLVPCLKDTTTGEFKNTVVFRIESRTYLKRFNQKSGWVINWAEIPKDVEVYALAIQDTNEIQDWSVSRMIVTPMLPISIGL